tara:strand:- start:40 stop:663 length:624 start_codon:yes stop_codon:yes gene_type:complete
MKVYVNGCSFSYGNSADNKFAWPDLLPYDVVNESWIAGSNKRIFRRTKKYLENNDVDIVILQLTDPYRDEFYNSINDLWLGQQGDYLHFDDESYKRKNIDQKLIKAQWEGFRKYNLLTRTEEQVKTETFYMINTMLQYFEVNNIKYLITAMSNKCLPTELIQPNNNILKPMSHIVDLENTHVDGHPNNDGHNQFARYIISEIKKKYE